MNVVSSRDRSRPDSQNQASPHRPGACPPAATMRHHRRSVDRVWPPALEVKLARISMDEGPSMNTHIIPPAPPVATRRQHSHCHNYYPDDTNEDHHNEPGEMRSNEHVLDPIQEVSSRSSSSRAYRNIPTPPIRVGSPRVIRKVGKAAEPSKAATSTPVSPSQRRRASILGPLSPSSSFEMDRHLKEHMIHPPHIDVQYLRRSKSISQYVGHDGFGSGGNDMESHDAGHGPIKAPLQRHSMYPTQYEAAAIAAFEAAQHNHHPGFHPRRMLSMEDDEDIKAFGADLFEQHTLANHSASRFQNHLESRDPPPSLQMPRAGKSPSPYRGGIAGLDSNLKMDTDDAAGATSERKDAADDFMSMPPLQRNSRPAYATDSRNPLSLPSSCASSRSPSRSPILSKSRPVSSGLRQPLTDTDEDSDQPNESIQQSPSKLDSILKDGDGEPITAASEIKESDTGNQNPIGDTEWKRATSPLSFLDVVASEHDHWRSPTLSSLASASGISSRGPSLSPRAAPPFQWLSPSSVSAAVMTGATVATTAAATGRAPPLRRRRKSVSEEADEIEAYDMTVEIPLIEAHDEISLQDIWRMEDEERKDRMNHRQSKTDVPADNSTMVQENIEKLGDPLAQMKGEQHAHEEARLIKQVLDVGLHHQHV
ncbi:hypothetical protein BGZ99_008538 [Dissophora globulifera]|uniref:Uncharacterized protein n=1 Tax=Dissophora globulifera TaxID=979702 RepID=A0A9P6RAQ9_9FUNG|nr:hypothetical protein BGZ99_008538 [Dissophora globulifera]